MSARRRRSRRRPPEVQAGLDQLKREVARTLTPRRPSPWGSQAQGRAGSGSDPAGEGSVVGRMLDIAARHVSRRRLLGPVPESRDGQPSPNPDGPDGGDR